MATSLDTGVPWVMCQQADAPDPIVSFIFQPLYGIVHRWLLICMNFVVNLFIMSHHYYVFVLVDLWFIYMLSLFSRSTLAMAFTVISLLQTLTRNQKCGQKIGVDGKTIFSILLCIVDLNLSTEQLYHTMHCCCKILMFKARLFKTKIFYVLLLLWTRLMWYLYFLSHWMS